MSTEPFEVVRIYDPEIVMHCEQDRIADYTYHRDLDKLEIPDAARPVVFRCQPLKRSQVRAVKRSSDDETMREAAFLFGVLEVRNIPREGGRFETVAPTHSKAGMITDEQLDAMGVGPNDISEIGEVVLRRSFLGLGEELSCRPPDTSVHAFGVMVTRLAAPKKDAETPTDG